MIAAPYQVRTEKSLTKLPTATTAPMIRHAVSKREVGISPFLPSKRVTAAGNPATAAPSKNQSVRKTIQIPLYSMQRWYSLQGRC